MERKVLDSLYIWFDGFTKSFYTTDREIQHMITIKEEHSKLVAEYCRELALSLALTAEDTVLAEAIGLCHDAGRFKQAVVYRTFQDHLSINHGPFGVEQLKAENIDGIMAANDWRAMDFAISCHNAVAIPQQPDKRLTEMAKIVRDADKLDIYRVVKPVKAEGSYSAKIVEDMLAGKLINYADLKTPNDRNLVMASWLFDINYSWTLRQISHKGYVDNLLEVLPKTSQLIKLRQKLDELLAANA